MFSSLFVALALTATGVFGAPSSADTVAALKAAPAQVDRIKILDQDSDFVFNFFNATPVKGAGGMLLSATVSDFPVLVNNGLAMTIGLIGPCGMNTPHSHPRGMEMLYLVNGTITTGMIAENGARFVFNTLQAGEAQVFLQGSIHYQQNELCDPILFVAALNNEDPGVESTAQRYFGLPPDVVAASLGDLGVEYVAGIEEMIPDNIALGRQECLDRCGIKRQGQPTTQRQPRNANNALPSSVATTWPSTMTKQYQPSSTPTQSTKTGNVLGALAESDSTVTANGGTSNSVLIALAAVVGAMAIGYIAIGVFWLVRRRRSAAKEANRFYVRPEMSGRSLVPTEEKYDTQ
ncbi:RmlC-like cupin [Dichomitus squalens LYAD-421 SS1]|uniref:RmlC-like cupin n=1 Tax=Dichomitus squalens (strain LYAD-421) TaxID=732165 RepID=R7SYI6_DICSQ|nr:RmlC-like cupin [Dichomitus squalens LYAD-421 SS1]EJF61214.1 RmlC-like cupin [Dichomitus squalens LYAD-421 SS1]